MEAKDAIDAAHAIVEALCPSANWRPSEDISIERIQMISFPQFVFAVWPYDSHEAFGAAFGAATHESLKTVNEWLERHPREGFNVLKVQAKAAVPVDTEVNAFGPNYIEIRFRAVLVKAL